MDKLAQLQQKEPSEITENQHKEWVNSKMTGKPKEFIDLTRILSYRPEIGFRVSSPPLAIVVPELGEIGR